MRFLTHAEMIQLSQTIGTCITNRDGSMPLYTDVDMRISTGEGQPR